MTAAAATTTQVHRVYINASPEAIWEAIVSPDWTNRYGYGGYSEFELRAGGAFRCRASEEFLAAGMPETVLDGEVIECDPPRRLVQTWRMCTGDEVKAEGFTRLTYEIEPSASAGTRLTVIHDVTGAPRLSALVSGELEDQGAGGGWDFVLSTLKTVLETGEDMRHTP